MAKSLSGKDRDRHRCVEAAIGGAIGSAALAGEGAESVRRRAHRSFAQGVGRIRSPRPGRQGACGR